MKLNVNKKTRNLMVGGLLSIVMAVLVSLFVANFKAIEAKAYAQDANSNSANDDYVVTIINEHDGNTQTFNYDSFGDAWYEVNNKSEFLNGKTTFTLSKDIEISNSQIENPDSNFFKNYKEEYNNKCFGCKGNGEQYQGKGNNDHFLLAMPGEMLTLDLNGHKLYKAEGVANYIFTPTFQVDHRNVNLVSNNEIKSEEDNGQIDAVSIFNDNLDIIKTLTIKNVKFDAKIQDSQVEVCSGVRCKTQYGLEIDNCLFTNYCQSSPIEVGSSVYKDLLATYTNKTIIKNSKFISNKAEEGWTKKTQGGAIHADGFVANFNIDYCIFNSNSSLGDGGAIMIGGADNYCDLHNNDAYITQTNVTNCTFESNIAGKEGGAISNSNVYFVVADCKFINNKANSNGGAIKIQRISLQNYEFSPVCGLSFDTTDMSDYEYRRIDCSTGMKWRDTNIKNNETIFTGNESGDSGGAIDISMTRLPLFAGRMIFKDNKAQNRGGAINFDCDQGYKTYITFQNHTYLYARNNWLPYREENIRLEDTGKSTIGSSYIMIPNYFDLNSEFGIWTHQRDHLVISRSIGPRINDWWKKNLHCDNGDGWFEYVSSEFGVKFWKD